jgi:hypothetical protein
MYRNSVLKLLFIYFFKKLFNFVKRDFPYR